MGIFKFDYEQSSRGWNYRQLCFNLKCREKRQTVFKINKEDKNNITGHKTEDDIRKIVEMYFKGKSLEEAINSIKSNNKDIIDELILIKNSWDRLNINKGEIK